MSNEDLGRLALRLLERLKSGIITLNEIAAIAARIAFPTHDNEMVDPWTLFRSITDEQDLNEQRVKAGANFKGDVINALGKIATYTAA